MLFVLFILLLFDVIYVYGGREGVLCCSVDGAVGWLCGETTLPR